MCGLMRRAIRLLQKAQSRLGRTGNPTDAGLYLTAIILISLVSLWGCRRSGVR
jgi:hypothetical protein